MSEVVLEFVENKWQLRDPAQPKVHPVYVDFLSKDFLRRFKEPKSSQLLYRAVSATGVNTVLDATAGLGSDSVMLAAWGFEVIACERNDKVFKLLLDGVKRLSQSDDTNLKAIAAAIHVFNVNATDKMRELKPDVIYLDPMYPDLKSSALPKKEMQLLRKLFSDVDPEEETRKLLSQALTAANKKVVIKRPPHAAQIQKPSRSLEGKAVRFDIYLAKN